MQAEWEGVVRMVLYPVIFEKDPLQAVDRVVDALQHKTLAKVTVDETLAALQQALQSPMPLAALLPQNHTEEMVRLYLAEVRQRLLALP